MGAGLKLCQYHHVFVSWVLQTSEKNKSHMMCARYLEIKLRFKLKISNNTPPHPPKQKHLGLA